MDGKSLVYTLGHVLREGDESTLLDDKTSYDYLWKAAIQFVKKTKCLTATQTITTVASQRVYDLDVEYSGLYLQDSYARYFVKINDGTNDTFVYSRDYDAVIFTNNTSTAAIPSSFSIIDKAVQFANITGTATTGSATSTLKDSTAPFANVAVGDNAHDVTDASDGVVTAVTSTSQITAPLFGGTDDTWTSADAYVIVPQGRKQIVFDPIPSTSDYTITVYYLKRPDPVYSPYGSYPFDTQYELALAYYAAWLYKYREDKPAYGDNYYKYWMMETNEAVRDTNRAMNRNGYKVVKFRRSLGNRSYR